jgi:uncharacterized RDD family membrane protein YckC
MNHDKNNKVDKGDSDEWEFDNLEFQDKVEQGDLPDELQLNETRILRNESTKLTLDFKAVPQAKTRTAMAFDIQDIKNNDTEKDDYELGPLPLRFIAFFIDVLFTFFLGLLLKWGAPLIRGLIQIVLDKYKLKLIFPEIVVMNFILVISTVVAFFFLVIIPLAFFNLSFGKKMLGLRVRSSEKYSLNISQVIKREIFFKPMGILLIAGFITPFFSKKRLSIHDMLSDTVVIKKEK